MPSTHWESSSYDAEFFAKSNNPSKTFAKKQLQRIVGDLSEADAATILDIGCGDGEITADMPLFINRFRRLDQHKQLNFKAVYGYDISTKMIAHASKTYAETHPSVQFSVQSAETMTDLAQFDLVFSSLALHWVNREVLTTKVFPNIKRALKPGGLTSITFGMEHPHLFQAVYDAMSATQFQQYFTGFSHAYNFYTEEVLTEVLEHCAFDNISVQTIEEPYDFNSIEDLVANISTWMPFFSPIPSEKMAAFKQLVGENYLKSVPVTTEGKVRLTSHFLDVKATAPTLAMSPVHTV